MFSVRVDNGGAADPRFFATSCTKAQGSYSALEGRGCQPEDLHQNTRRITLGPYNTQHRNYNFEYYLGIFLEMHNCITHFSNFESGPLAPDSTKWPLNYYEGILFEFVLTRLVETRTAIVHRNLENWDELKEFLKNTYTE